MTSGELATSLTAALAVLGDAPAREALLEAMGEGTSSSTRRAVLWSLADFEKQAIDRILLSRDQDGLAPGIDPGEELTERDVWAYARAARLPTHEVRARYEALAERYPLKLSWRTRGT
ncbi:wHTH domain-containing protein [Streptomyces griseoloalbus]|uniref:wHTH domain-containing protein n=1 Tax=Streptomyces griseoloalbus TaxID=67303 RepID=UPI001608153B|nr:hypothetical protein [Streptomyces albaduncus]